MVGDTPACDDSCRGCAQKKHGGGGVDQPHAGAYWLAQTIRATHSTSTMAMSRLG